MGAALQNRWKELWHRLGVDENTPGLAAAGGALLYAYAEPQRHYHTTAHLEDVLQKLDWAKSALEQSGELATLSAAQKQRMFDTIELALWYHDAVYNPRAKDNEAQSRDWLSQDAAAFKLPATVTADAARLVDLTAHHNRAHALDEKIMADCDLAILGAAPEAFHAYDTAIRQEYAHVSNAQYRLGRAKVLSAFLGQEPLFKTAAFQQAFGTNARQNLSRALHPLNRPTWRRWLGW